MKRVPQRYRVLQLALQRGQDGFTRGHAAYEVGCYELASRIGELEAEGVEFHREPESGKNRFGDPTHWVRYRVRYCPPVLLAWLKEAKA